MPSNLEMKSKEEVSLEKIKEEGIKHLNRLLDRLDKLAQAAVELQKSVCGGTFLLVGDCWEHFGDCSSCPNMPIMDTCVEIGLGVSKLLEETKKLLEG